MKRRVRKGREENAPPRHVRRPWRRTSEDEGQADCGKEEALEARGPLNGTMTKKEQVKGQGCVASPWF